MSSQTFTTTISTVTYSDDSGIPGIEYGNEVKVCASLDDYNLRTLTVKIGLC